MSARKHVVLALVVIAVAIAIRCGADTRNTRPLPGIGLQGPVYVIDAKTGRCFELSNQYDDRRMTLFKAVESSNCERAK